MNTPTEINWRRLLAARYESEPDTRVKEVLTALPESVVNQIAVAHDYKGTLNVIWKHKPLPEEIGQVDVAWDYVGCEEYTAHYFLTPITSEGWGTWE